MAQAGQEIFNGAKGICFTCHLREGTGGPLAPSLTDAEWLNIDGEYESIVKIVVAGVPQPTQYSRRDAAPRWPTAHRRTGARGRRLRLHAQPLTPNGYREIPPQVRSTLSSPRRFRRHLPTSPTRR